jgi:hypothetical protein
VNKEKLRKYFQRFCHWLQTVPHYANRHEGEVQHCHNCDSDFSGNFCPICSQRAEVGRVGYTVAIGCPLTIGSHDNGFCGSYYYECL